jgi:hypothetical protein
VSQWVKTAILAMSAQCRLLSHERQNRRPTILSFSATTGHASNQAAASLDHLVGGDEQTRRDGQPKRLRGFKVEHGFVFGRCLHRKIGWLGTA